MRHGFPNLLFAAGELRAFDISDGTVPAWSSIRGTPGRRWRHPAFMIVQCSVTAGFSWFFASQLLGHDVPYFAAVRELVPDLD
jgi:hypothetical protein